MAIDRPPNTTHQVVSPDADSEAQESHSPVLVSRRRLLSAGLGLGAALLWTGRAWPAGEMAHGSSSMSPPGTPQVTPPATAGPLVEPEVRRSAGGLLSTTLRIRYAYQDIGGYKLHLRTYEGTTPGPTLRVRPGDVMRFRLVNELPPNRDAQPSDHNLPNRFNTTNLHVHGMHVSPAGIADNVLREMEPGRTYDIEIPIPASHPPGTYWYHPHRHGSANVQVGSGMAGAIIVEGDFAGVPQIAHAQDRVLLLQQLAFDALGTVESFDTVWPMQAARLFTVNGQLRPTITMRPGEVQRWRVIHAGFHDSTPIGLDGHLLHEIGADGIALPRNADAEKHPRGAGPAHRRAGAGRRKPARIRCAACPSTRVKAKIARGCWPTSVVAGAPMPMDLPKALPPPPLAADPSPKRSQVAGRSRSRRRRRRQAATISASSASWSTGASSITTASTTASAWAPSRSGRSSISTRARSSFFTSTPIRSSSRRSMAWRLDVPVWRDTVNVRGHETVTIRSRFEDFTGVFVLHCHIFNHEDIGMMQTIEVY